MSDKVADIDILLVIRNQRKNGPTSSGAINDSFTEIAHDLSEISSQWNNRLVPLLDALPAGSPDTTVDAFLNGLDGKTVYTNSDATNTVDTTYYSTPKSRPTTIYEQFRDVYTSLTTLEEDLENQINGLAVTAAQIAIEDTSSIYAAVNVEKALEEVMNKVNLLTSLDFSQVAQHILPSLDDTYDLGSSSRRWRDLYLGPASLHIIATAAQAGGSSKDYSFEVDSTTGDLLLKDGATSLFIFGTTGTLAIPELASAPAPTVGFGKLFAKSSDNKLYFLRSDGTEHNLTEVSGSFSGTTNIVPKFDSATTITDSSIQDDGTSVGINITDFNATNVLHIQSGGSLQPDRPAAGATDIVLIEAGDGGAGIVLAGATGSTSYLGFGFPFENMDDYGVKVDNSVGELSLKVQGNDVLTIDNNQIMDTTSGTYAQPGFSWTSDTDTGISNNNTNELAFVTSGLEKVRITHDGNFIIGLHQRVAGDDGRQVSRLEISNGNWLETGGLEEYGIKLQQTAAQTSGSWSAIYIDVTDQITSSTGYLLNLRVDDFPIFTLDQDGDILSEGALIRMGTNSTISNSGGTMTIDGSSELLLDGNTGGITVKSDMTWDNTNGPQVLNVAATVTTPNIIIDQGDPDTGFGSRGDDQLSIIVGGENALEFSESGGVATAFFDAHVIVGAGSQCGTQTGDLLLVAGTDIIFHKDFKSEAATGPIIIDGAGSSTVPQIVPNQNLATTGMSVSSAGDFLHFISDGVERLRVLTTGVNVYDDMAFQQNSQISTTVNDLTFNAAGTLRFTTSGVEHWRIQDNGNLVAQNTEQLILPQNNDPTLPSLAFGDGNTGFWEQADNILAVGVAGTVRFQWTVNSFQGNLTGAPSIRNADSTATNANIHPDRADLDTGIGYAGEDQLSLIAGGLEGVRITETGGTDIQALFKDGTNSLPSISFISDPDTGVYLGSSDVLAFTTSGVEQWRIADNGNLVSQSTTDIDMSGTTTNRLWLPTLNNASNIALSFGGDTGTGIYSTDSTDLLFALAFTPTFTMDSQGFYISTIANGAILSVDNPSSTVPSIRPDILDPNTGIGRFGDDQLSIISGGLEVMRALESSNNPQALFANGLVTAPSISFLGDLDTGLYHPNADEIMFTTSGVNQMILDSSGDVGIGTILPSSRLEVETSTIEGRQAVTIDQNDADQPFIDFQGTTGGDVDSSISTHSTAGTIQGWVQIEINGVKRWMPFYDDPSA